MEGVQKKLDEFRDYRRNQKPPKVESGHIVGLLTSHYLNGYCLSVVFCVLVKLTQTF